jgi:hypothetical protein
VTFILKPVLSRNPCSEPPSCFQSYSRLNYLSHGDVPSYRVLEGSRAVFNRKLDKFRRQPSLLCDVSSRSGCSRSRGFVLLEWTHRGLHSTFNHDLIHQRKLYPRVLRDYLTSALAVRQAADYGEAGVSAKVARRQVRRAAQFVNAAQEVIGREQGRRS